MTHREQLVETARDALDRAYVEHVGWYSGDRYAEAVVHAVLPQIHTVDDLILLPIDTLLVSDSLSITYVWHGPLGTLRSITTWLDHEPEAVFARGALTIVWQP